MTWKKGIAEWIENEIVHISVVFSWNLPDARKKILCLPKKMKVLIGGPAVYANPNYLSDIAGIGKQANALIHHNPDATFTTKGCIRNCPFCIVPKIEGKLIELADKEWKPNKIVCDNNLLAASQTHFDHVIDRLKESRIKGIDFQGIDARVMTEHHAQRLAELPNVVLHFAWDHIKEEKYVRRAITHLSDAGIKPKNMRVYVLFGYKDTPEEALYRLQEIKNLGIMPNPMRYQPINTLKKNSYIGEHWTERQLKDYMRYWGRQIYLWKIPFEEYIYNYRSNK